MPSFLARRLYATTSNALHVNAHQFKQYIQLTDGSITYITSLSPARPFIQLNIDSVSHPSWNPQLRDKLLMDNHGEVAKFRKRFGAGGEDDFAVAAGKFTGTIRTVDSQTKSSTKTKGKKKK